MIIQTPYLRKTLIQCCVLFTVGIMACTPTTENNEPKTKPVVVPGEVHLAPNSPKKAYVKTTTLTMSQHPLLVPLAGKIVYNESLTSRISSPVAGRVVNTPIVLGKPVKIGDTLLELDSPEVADAEASYVKADADLTKARKALARQQELYAGKAIAQKDLEQAQNDFNDAHSELQRVLDRLKNLHISTQQTDGRFSLRAPIAGTVVERNVNPGIEVRSDRDTPLFVISDIKKLTVLMDVYEVNLSKIRQGQRLSISVPAYADDVFPATVTYIGQILNENTRTVQVRCDIPNPDGRLLPGMFATINVESDPSDQAIVIPLTAVFTEDEADFVFIALDENHYLQRQVEIGLRLKDKAVITKGLQANEQLVSEGALMLRGEEEVESDPDNNKQ
ncbi:efflux RND transporter periplasmic adaptor subunit [Methylomonas sp. AM2-LC]|uniref:efflux RND transporter periplasmic adaptor subunit n=1 Tax=Methylomonas sp. AM2-LC TaxID=3153301 RepID=UPI00326450A3